jgi:uncharacterized protein (DUF2236 family)
MASMVQREKVLLLAWGPAVLLQLAHPLVARGVADHSAFGRERWSRTRRFRRTLQAMLDISFGTEQEAGLAFARINAIHDRVHGELPGPAGVFAAGTVYSAHDPALLAWVHATLLDMSLRVYERFVGALRPEDRDRYCAEASLVERPLGIPDGRLPRSAQALEHYMDTMLASGQISVTGAARQVAREIVEPEAPRLARPGVALLRLTTVGLLPPPIRAAYDLPWSPGHEARLRRWAWLVRTLLPFTPSVLRHWPASPASARAPHRSGCPVASLTRRLRLPAAGRSR